MADTRARIALLILAAALALLAWALNTAAPSRPMAPGPDWTTPTTTVALLGA